MKKILYISSFLPYDTPFAGSKTSYRILKNIAKNYKVNLLSFSTEVEKKYVEDFKQFCKNESNINLIDIVHVSNFTRVLFFFLPAFLVARFSFKYLFSLKKQYDFIYIDWSQSIVFGYLLSKILDIPIIYYYSKFGKKIQRRKKLFEKAYFWI